ncbi:hypothetical protein A7K93_09650 [Candidatus Methylacidiphilum fumarolicum]|nr:hypothetical protein A7K73_10885 [Candidatus Methylacidiphilum fumarolicum]TFE71834.1 hypothetical protein A7K72_10125 [Candidatus Methylacidiphilum fumarolicum]TFE72026.1 hypothetical protein A7K93_09650 [Candidatus Methylacidiphilum fumarolicum]TFE76468.1 hypothetical protein A7D33_09960 [Candidatus Methylacidiphilum fumarolicum]
MTNIYSPKKFGGLIGRSVHTLQRKATGKGNGCKTNTDEPAVLHAPVQSEGDRTKGKESTAQSLMQESASAGQKEDLKESAGSVCRFCLA